jgi:hypothetical protein
MEETKKKHVKVNTNQLSYEDLKNAAQQMSAQLDAVVRENSQLREALKQAQMGNMFAQLEFQFKVISNAEMFPADFVEQCISSIVEVMSPAKEEEKEKEEEE